MIQLIKDNILVPKKRKYVTENEYLMQIEKNKKAHSMAYKKKKTKDSTKKYI